jgi:restriction system protein
MHTELANRSLDNSRPGGIDRIYVHAKRFAEGNTVGSRAIRDFFGNLDRYKATKGLVVTASTFSSSARQIAGQLSKQIVLIGGDQLTHLMICHGVGCRIEGKRASNITC